MPSYKGQHPLEKKWKIGKSEIIYIIAGLLIAVYMLLFFFKELHGEQKFMKHINQEHNHAGKKYQDNILSVSQYKQTS